MPQLSKGPGPCYVINKKKVQIGDGGFCSWSVSHYFVYILYRQVF